MKYYILIFWAVATAFSAPVELSVGAIYKGKYPVGGSGEPYSVSSWERFSGSIVVDPNMDNGVAAKGLAAFTDASSKKRILVHYPMKGAFGADPKVVEYTYTFRAKFYPEGASMPDGLYDRAIAGVGFHDESGTASTGKQVTLGFYLSDRLKGRDGVPCVGLIGESGYLMHKVKEMNWMDGQMHEYTVKKYSRDGVVHISVSIDGSLVDDAPVYDDLPPGPTQHVGFWYGTATAGTLNGTVELMEFGNPVLPYAIGPENDPRDIRNGDEIYSHGYADQPYVVVNADKSITCILTGGSGQEGAAGQQVVSLRSLDGGKTWSEPVAIEPAGSPSSSWGLPVITPTGRIYALYTFNETNMKTVLDFLGRPYERVDAVGQFVFRYSDDMGKTWSAERYRIPIRVTEMDRTNVYRGDVNGDGKVDVDDPKFFWSPAAAYSDGKTVYVGIAKIMDFDPDNGSTGSEGWVMTSSNLLTENDPHKIVWELKPEGTRGLRSRSGRVSEETSVSKLSNGSLVALCRTTQGVILAFYSSDEGRTWSSPESLGYAASGRPLKNPRAKPCIWAIGSGRYLIWFENNGTKGFEHRNPAWVALAHEKNGRLVCSEPEILLYDRNPNIRISYPDLFMLDGKYVLTETQKHVARIHVIPQRIINGLDGQLSRNLSNPQDFAVEWRSGQNRNVSLPNIPDVQKKGLTFEFWVRFTALDKDEVLLDSTAGSGAGLKISVTAGRLEFTLSDGNRSQTLRSDAGRFSLAGWNHVVCIVEPGPRIMMGVINGQLSDGGSDSEFGWVRYPRDMRHVGNTPAVYVSGKTRGALGLMRYYDRPLMVSEAVSLYVAGFKK